MNRTKDPEPTPPPGSEDTPALPELITAPSKATSKEVLPPPVPLSTRATRTIKHDEEIDHDMDDEEDELLPFREESLLYLRAVDRVRGAVQTEREQLFYGRANIHRIARDPRNLPLHPRDPVEEGFYQPITPDIPLWNREILESRLTREDLKKQHYFHHENGNLLYEPTYLSTSVLRPSFPQLYLEQQLHTHIHAPQVYSGKDMWYCFHVDLISLKFQDMENMSLEERECRELESQYEEYKRRETVGLVKFYRDKIAALRIVAKSQSMSLGQMNEGAAGRIALARELLSTLLQLVECREQHDREEWEMRILFKQMYSKWLGIRAIRSDITRNMKARGFWQHDLTPLVPVDSQPATTIPDTVVSGPPDPSGTPIHISSSSSNDLPVDGQQTNIQQSPSDPAAPSPSPSPSELPALYTTNPNPSPSNPLPPPPPPPLPPSIPAPIEEKENIQNKDGQTITQLPASYPQYPAPPTNAPALYSGPYGPPIPQYAPPSTTTTAPPTSTTQQPPYPQYPPPSSAINYPSPQTQPISNPSYPEQPYPFPSSGTYPEQQPYTMSYAGMSTTYPPPSIAASYPQPPASPSEINSPTDPSTARSDGSIDAPPHTIPTSSSSTHDNHHNNNRMDEETLLSPREMQVQETARQKLLAGKVYVGYPLQLRVKKLSTPIKVEKKRWKEELLTEIDERQKIRELTLFLDNQGKNLNVGTELLSTEVARAQVEQRMRAMRRLPGRPIFVPLIDKNIEVISESQCLPEEQERRKLLQHYGMYLELRINDNIVRRTPIHTLNIPSFTVHIHCSSDLRLVAMPASITCTLYHKRAWFDEKLADIILPVPEFGAAPSIQHSQFSGNHIGESGEGRYINGSLECCIYWAVDHSKEVLELKQSDIEHMNHDEKHRHMMRLKIVELTKNLGSRFDPNDPRNAELVELLRRQKIELKHIRSFRAVDFPKELLFVPTSSLPSARRKVLQARNASALLTEPVPLQDKEISEHLFALVNVGTDNNTTSDVDENALANLNNKSVHAWRDKVKFLTLQHQIYDVSEVVNETPLPDFAFDLTALDKLFEPRRQLRVKRTPPPVLSAPANCHVIIQIIKAQNLPIRKREEKQDNEHTRIFVELEFQHNAKRTRVGIGSNCNWDEIVTLPFHPPANSFSPTHLQQVTDEITFNLFDEYISSRETDPRLKHTRLQHTNFRYIGSFSVPFTTIYQNGKIEGPFRLNIPLLHLGYELPNPKLPSFLFIYATLDPLLTTPIAPPLHFAKINDFYRYALQWVDEIHAAGTYFRKRMLLSIVGDINGSPQCITRYMTPQKPPLKYEKPAIFTRFVSQIPFVEDAQMSQGQAAEIWCNSRELFALAGGDWEEHALLLANYFMWYDSLHPSGFKTFVVLGQGFPEGSTAYVLRLGVSSGAISAIYLINAVTGLSYDLRNDAERESCPLVSIGCIFNDENIWANIQALDDPTRIDYSLHDHKLWKPLFTPKFSQAYCSQQFGINFATIQQSIAYYECTPEYYMDRANRIERIIERRFEKWRVLRTNWDYGVCKILRDFLVNFEYYEQGEIDALNIDKPMQQLRTAYSNIYGFPLHFAESGEDSYVENSDDNPVVHGVKNTRVHENEDARTVFALAVYVHPYPNRMGSVWVYIAALADK